MIAYTTCYDYIACNAGNERWAGQANVRQTVCDAHTQRTDLPRRGPGENYSFP
jgi:hypothetical protein